jgi:hypothetical protein
LIIRFWFDEPNILFAVLLRYFFLVEVLFLKLVELFNKVLVLGVVLVRFDADLPDVY